MVYNGIVMKLFVWKIWATCVRLQNRYRVRRPLNKEERIAVFRSDHMGDVILSLEAIYGICEQYPESEVWVLTNEHYRPLVAMVPGVAGFIPYHKGMSLAQKWACMESPSKRSFFGIYRFMSWGYLWSSSVDVVSKHSSSNGL